MRVSCITILRTSSVHPWWKTFLGKSVFFWLHIASLGSAHRSVLLFCQVSGNKETICSNSTQQVQHFCSAVIYAHMSCELLCSHCSKLALWACLGWICMTGRKERKKEFQTAFLPPFNARGRFMRSSPSKISLTTSSAAPLLCWSTQGLRNMKGGGGGSRNEQRRAWISLSPTQALISWTEESFFVLS